MSKRLQEPQQIRTKWNVTIILLEKEDVGSNERINPQSEDMAPYVERYPLIRGDTQELEKNKIAKWGKTVGQMCALLGVVASVLTIYLFFKG